jgi:AbrB family looped-hinge helix DNA binding protein
MSAVTVSSKYQIVLPKDIRESMKIRPGQKLQVIEWGGTIRIVPVRPLHEIRGMFKDLENDFEREVDREL